MKNFFLSRNDRFGVELADHFGRTGGVARIHAAVGRSGGGGGGGASVAIQRSSRRLVGRWLDAETDAATASGRWRVERRGGDAGAVLRRPRRAVGSGSGLAARTTPSSPLFHHGAQLFQFAARRLILFGHPSRFFYFHFKIVENY